jgi:hypothetical protein
MYHPDPMINVALDRQAERVRKVQAVGLPQSVEWAASARLPNKHGPHPMARPTLGRVLILLAAATLVVVWLAWLVS